MSEAAVSNNPTDRVLAILEAAGHPAKRVGACWMAPCPAHPDNKPSLSITESATGNALVYCHAGCTTAEVCRAIDLTLGDLFPDRPPKVAHINSAGRFKAAYIYTDEDGVVLYRVVRYEPKTFRQERPNLSGGWTSGLMDARRVLYHLPQIMKAKAERRPIWIVEGEKDVENLDWHINGAATCNAMGAGSWRPEYTEALTGTAKVHIIADRDEKGYNHARHVARELAPHVGRVIVLEAAEGKDITDHLRAGHPIKDLAKLWDSDTPDDWLDGPTDVAPEEPERNWVTLNLLTIPELRLLKPPPPLITGLLDQESLAVLYGPPKSMKTFLALSWALAISTGSWWQGLEVAQRPVVYVAAEGQAHLIHRIDAWLAHHKQYGDPGPFHPFIAPVNLFHPERAGQFREAILELDPGFVVFDTLARCSVGADENSGRDMGIVVEQADILKAATGACVLVVHHDNRAGTNMRGHSSLDGAVDTAVSIVKDDGLIRAELKFQKNHADGTVFRLGIFPAAESVTLDRYRGAVSDELTVGAEVMLETLSVIGKAGPVSTTQWLKSCEGVTERTFYRTRGGLLEKKYVAVTGPGKGGSYAITAIGLSLLNGGQDDF